jgi:hypothetical protein
VAALLGTAFFVVEVNVIDRGASVKCHAAAGRAACDAK